MRAGPATLGLRLTCQAQLSYLAAIPEEEKRKGASASSVRSKVIRLIPDRTDSPHCGLISMTWLGGREKLLLPFLIFMEDMFFKLV